MDAQTATSRFFATPELVLLLFECLKPEKIDLLVLSKVSKQLRALALPVLVRKLCVPLSQTKSISLCLDGNPGLVECIRFLRIWDDDVHRVFRFNNFPSTTLSFGYVARFTLLDDLGHLLIHVQNRATKPLPLVDISFGQAGSQDLVIELRQVPRIVQRIASLRIMVDFDERYYEDPPGHFDEDVFHQHIEEGWLNLSVLMEMISLSQSNSSSTSFRLFDFEDYRYDEANLDKVPEQLWTSLASHLALRLTHFSLFLPSTEMKSFGTRAILNGTTWPSLRSLRVSGCASPRDDWDAVRDNLALFLTSNPQLEDLNLFFIEEETPVAFEFTTQTFPNLRTLALRIDSNNCNSTAAFASRHSCIQEVSFKSTWDDIGAIEEIVEQAAFLSTLRVIRVSHETAADFIRRGANVAHIHLNLDADFETLGLEQWLFSNRTASARVTCLDIEFDCEGFRTLAVKLEQDVPSGSLPNLTELCICLATEYGSGEAQTPAQAVDTLKNFLRAVRGLSSKLTAIRLEDRNGEPLPEGDDSFTVPLADLSPALRFVTWHATKANITQCFRVVKSETQARLQRLPASFRMVVNEEDGIWEQPSDVRKENTLFDHSGPVPRLRFA